MQFENVVWQPGPCICAQNPYGKIKVKDMDEEEEEEDKKRGKEYLGRRGFGLGYRVPVAREHFNTA